VAWVSFRAFDERGVEGLPVALAALLRGLLLSAAVLPSLSQVMRALDLAVWEGQTRRQGGTDPPRFFVPLAALGGQIEGFCGWVWLAARGCKCGQRSPREMRCCYETCYESDFVLVTLRS